MYNRRMKLLCEVIKSHGWILWDPLFPLPSLITPAAMETTLGTVQGYAEHNRKMMWRRSRLREAPERKK